MSYGYIYDDEFYEYIRRGASKTAAILVPFVAKELVVRSVLDVGCGAGAWIAEYLNAGFNPALGVDGEYVSHESLLIPHVNFQGRNIAQPFDLPQRFDLVQCLEVGEHIPNTCSEVLVENLVKHGSVILFSAAPPGKGGEHHVNEQPYEYWRELFARKGYRP